MAGLNRRDAALYLVATALAQAARAQSEGARWLSWPAARATPVLKLPDLDGQLWDLAQEKGRPVLLNFWASWCEPCRAEMPSLAVLQSQFSASRLRVVAVNFKESATGVRRFRDTHASTLHHVRDSYGEAARSWGVRSFPTTFVINPAGRASLTIEGELDWGSAAVQQRLNGFL
jgi:thiol-disulfide isomerase/thioredoxin